MSFTCSQCGYAFDPLEDDGTGPFCDCPRCNGLAIENDGGTASAATPFRTGASSDIDPLNFSSRTGARPLSPGLFESYFDEARSGEQSPAGGSPPPPPPDPEDIHRQPTHLLGLDGRPSPDAQQEVSTPSAATPDIDPLAFLQDRGTDPRATASPAVSGPQAAADLFGPPPDVDPGGLDVSTQVIPPGERRSWDGIEPSRPQPPPPPAERDQKIPAPIVEIEEQHLGTEVVSASEMASIIAAHRDPAAPEPWPQVDLADAGTSVASAEELAAMAAATITDPGASAALEVDGTAIASADEMAALITASEMASSEVDEYLTSPPTERGDALTAPVSADVEDDPFRPPSMDFDDLSAELLPQGIPIPPEIEQAGTEPAFGDLLSGHMIVASDRVAGELPTPPGEQLLIDDDEDLAELSRRLDAHFSTDPSAARAHTGDWVISPRQERGAPPPLPGQSAAEFSSPGAEHLPLPDLAPPEPIKEDPTGFKGAIPTALEAGPTPRVLSPGLFVSMIVIALLCMLGGAGMGFFLVVSKESKGPVGGKAQAQQLLGEGNRLLIAGDPQNAIPILEKALSYDPVLAPAYRSLGTAYGKLGKHEQAAKNYGLYVRLAPEGKDPSVVRSMLEKHLGHKLEE